jgi:hypothetical protein
MDQSNINQTREKGKHPDYTCGLPPTGNPPCAASCSGARALVWLKAHARRRSSPVTERCGLRGGDKAAKEASSSACGCGSDSFQTTSALTKTVSNE